MFHKPILNVMSSISSNFVRRALALTLALLCLARLHADTRLVNISSRGVVGSAQGQIIAGFVIPAGGSKTLLIRAAGPALTSMGVSGALANPKIVVVDSTGATVAQNDDWSLLLAPEFSAVGAFPFALGSADSALTVTLPPGVYSAIVTGATATSGVALAEIYETDTNNVLVNLSTRGNVGTGDQVLIAGFVVTGSGAPRQLLLRGVGPELAAHGVTSPMADPQIVLYNGAGVQLGSNDDWGTAATSNEVSASVLTAAASGSGAFALTTGSKDAAMIATVAPGLYSLQLFGKNSSTGIALAEIYDVTNLSLGLTAPAITTQPASASVAVGASATFTVQASGTAVAYQWFKNGAAISGANSATLKISSAASADAGNYTVTVTNAAGVATSSAAALTVTP